MKKIADSQPNLKINKEWFIQSKTTPIEKTYSFLQKLGEGAFGLVYKAQMVGTQIFRAVKIIRKELVTKKGSLIEQVNILRILDHPNIVRLFQTFEDQYSIYLVLEYCEGGDLFQKCTNGHNLSENIAKRYFRDMVKAINYCHSKGICHRDLKLQNFLFLDKSKRSALKLADFGLSKLLDSKVKKKAQPVHKMTSVVGTSYYISPQVLSGKYDILCDIWSLGVLLIILLTGEPPFNGENDQQICRQILSSKFQLPSQLLKKISPQAKNLISKCLSSSESRIKAHEILQHPWLSHQRNYYLSKQDIERLRNFSSCSAMKKVVMSIIASQADTKDIQKITQMFLQLDTNHDGVISKQELKQGFMLIKFDTAEKRTNVEQIFQQVDTNGDGQISYTEFITAMLGTQICQKSDNFDLAWKILDENGDGTISQQQLSHLLEIQQKQESEPESKLLAFLMSQCDKDGNGLIDYQELMKQLQD